MRPDGVDLDQRDSALRERRCSMLLGKPFVVALVIAVGSPLATPGALAAQPLATQAALQADDAFWSPALAPAGPLVVLVSLPAQRAYVYRNGVRIGISPVSTGRAGYETPPGIYTVLGKEREHHSNLYDNAPMPYMQRLTWDGLALHAGTLPGHPASHGCVRLPTTFAEQLFAITTPGTTVVIADRDTPLPTIASPGLFAPIDAAGNPMQPPATETTTFAWEPGRSPSGPITIVLSTHDRQLVMLRNGVRIGQSAISFDGPAPAGTSAYVLLEGRLPEPSRIVPGRNRLRWLRLALPQGTPPAADASEEALASAIVIPQAFAQDVYDALVPGATVIVTDQPVQPTPAQSTTVMQSGSGTH
jgi:lipoprotein-anchoring transpeptidase ErfK/SrfK